MKISVQDIDHHRNGVAGEGFYVIRFGWDGRTMLATVFGYCPYGDDAAQNYADPHVAVIDLDLAHETVQMFDGNAWRGDHFARALYAAIDEFHRHGMRLESTT